MSIKKIYPKTILEVKEHIKKQIPSLYLSSQTSTVIPFEILNKYYDELTIVELNSLPKKMELNQDNNLVICGPVNWQEASDFLIPLGFEIMTAPTESLASVLAGAATSATGERCFSFGTLRDQIISIEYLNYKGETKTLSNQAITRDDFNSYQDDYIRYKELKNAPYPRLEKQIDYMIGTEGQLGVITQIELNVTKKDNSQYLFILLPKWEEDDSKHLEIAKAIQNFRHMVLICELTDANSFNYLPEEQRLNQKGDVIFFELREKSFDDFYENFLMQLSFYDEDKVFEIPAQKFHHLRSHIPRAINEVNSKNGIQKIGTDIQSTQEDFPKLLAKYRELSKKGIAYNLFGHFGDAHLHFNFMPRQEQLSLAKSEIKHLYQGLDDITCSPFAEHGIGIIKQDFIKKFLNQNQYVIFKLLKKEFDPKDNFFPKGYLSLRQ